MSEIIRVEKKEFYTCMANYHLLDMNLSLKTIGLMSKILSLPPNWEFNLKGLAIICKDGIDSVRSAIRELEEFGYLKRKQVKNTKGYFSKIEYTIYEKPFLDNSITGKTTQ